MASPAGAKHLFVTGQPGVGKSTLISSVLAHLQASGALPAGSFQGFWTEETRSAATGERSGFDVVTWERGGGSRRGPLARASGGAAKGPPVGKYTVNLESFERLALPALELPEDPAGAAAGPRLVVIDEVGKMELCSRAFMPAVWAALDAGPVVFGSVPVPRYGRSIPEVERLKARPDVEVVTVTKANRDELAGQLADALAARLQV